MEKGSYRIGDEEVVDHPHVRDSWVNGWLEGNVLIPQLFLGINTCTLAAILKDDDSDFEQIYPSRLTPQQMEKAIANMHRAHAAFSIPVVTADKLIQIGSNCATIPDRIQSLWDDASSTAANAINCFISKDPALRLKTSEDLRAVVFKIREILCSEEFKPFAYEYRTHLKQSTPASRDIDTYRENISAFVMNKLSQQHFEMPPEYVKALCACLGFYTVD